MLVVHGDTSVATAAFVVSVVSICSLASARRLAAEGLVSSVTAANYSTDPAGRIHPAGVATTAVIDHTAVHLHRISSSNSHRSYRLLLPGVGVIVRKENGGRDRL